MKTVAEWDGEKFCFTPAEQKAIGEMANRKAGFCKITVETVTAQRTTGRHSQNNAIHGYAKQIADYTGQDVESIKTYCKLQAVGRGYPIKRNAHGVPIMSFLTGEPEPESTANVDTVQAGYLIDELVKLAGELGIVLERE